MDTKINKSCNTKKKMGVKLKSEIKDQNIFKSF